MSAMCTFTHITLYKGSRKKSSRGMWVWRYKALVAGTLRKELFLRLPLENVHAECVS